MSGFCTVSSHRTRDTAQQYLIGCSLLARDVVRDPGAGIRPSSRSALRRDSFRMNHERKLAETGRPAIGERSLVADARLDDSHLIFRLRGFLRPYDHLRIRRGSHRNDDHATDNPRLVGFGGEGVRR
jgi:hypothetical protein